MSGHRATFILSTGRCGTQWLAAALGAAWGEAGWVEHEPPLPGYNPRAGLGQGPGGLPPVLEKLLETIESRLEGRPGVWCGHPLWSALPALGERLRGRVAIVHLVRDPVSTACSWLTHGAYQPSLAPHLPVKVLLAPQDAGVRFPEYAVRWDGLGAYEKCLYFWTEVNALGLEWEARGGHPWLRLRFEDLFGGDGLGRLLEFLGLPWSEELDALRSRQVDKFRYVTWALEAWEAIAAHPETVRIARQLGYGLEGIEQAQLVRRYMYGESVDRR